MDKVVAHSMYFDIMCARSDAAQQNGVGGHEQDAYPQTPPKKKAGQGSLAGVFKSFQDVVGCFHMHPTRLN